VKKGKKEIGSKVTFRELDGKKEKGFFGGGERRRTVPKKH